MGSAAAPKGVALEERSEGTRSGWGMWFVTPEKACVCVRARTCILIHLYIYYSNYSNLYSIYLYLFRL